jgi:hypothetical protein
MVRLSSGSPKFLSALRSTSSALEECGSRLSNSPASDSNAEGRWAIAITVAAIQAGTIRKRSQTTARPLRFQANPLREGREFFRGTVIAYPAAAHHMRAVLPHRPGVLDGSGCQPGSQRLLPARWARFPLE